METEQWGAAHAVVSAMAVGSFEMRLHESANRTDPVSKKTWEGRHAKPVRRVVGSSDHVAPSADDRKPSGGSSASD
jgi:hypothetical protein